MMELDTLKRANELYISEVPDEPDSRPIRRDVYVAETHEQAVETTMPYILDKYDKYAEWGAVEEGPEDDRERFEEICEGRYLIGTPDDVLDQIEEMRDELGINHIIARVQWPGMNTEHAKRAIQLIGKEVIPRMHEL